MLCIYRLLVLGPSSRFVASVTPSDADQASGALCSSFFTVRIHRLGARISSHIR
jgi:hypothetical protein